MRIETSCYTLRCMGLMDCQWVAGMLKLFEEREVNIRKLTFLPSFQTLSQYRLEVQFDLETPSKQVFLNHVQAYLDTLPQGCQKVLIPA